MSRVLPSDHRDIPSQLRYRVLSGLGTSPMLSPSPLVIPNSTPEMVYTRRHRACSPDARLYVTMSPIVLSYDHCRELITGFASCTINHTLRFATVVLATHSIIHISRSSLFHKKGDLQTPRDRRIDGRERLHIFGHKVRRVAHREYRLSGKGPKR